MAQLVESIEGMADACKFFETPITGGNVSLYNETLGEGIYPTPVIGIIGLMKTAKPTPLHFQSEGRVVMLIGGLGESDHTRFGGTQYAKVVLKSMWGLPPGLDLDYERRVQAAIREIAGEGLAESAHDISDGGLAVTLAECSFGPGGMGVRAALDTDAPLELALFHEGPSRIIVSTSDPKRVRQIAVSHGVECMEMGVTIKGRYQVSNRGAMLIDCSLSDLKQPWESSLERLLHQP
jgi:phosphoribosylformylglycinamidine synthase